MRNMVTFTATVTTVLFIVMSFNLSSFLTLESFGLAFFTLICLCVMFSLINCTFIYFKLLRSNFGTSEYIWALANDHRRGGFTSFPSIVRALLGLLEVAFGLFLLVETVLWYIDLTNAGMVYPLTVFCWMYMAMKVLEYLFGGKLY